MEKGSPVGPVAARLGPFNTYVTRFDCAHVDLFVDLTMACVYEMHMPTGPICSLFTRIV